jgi:HNH endonuclease
LKVDWPDERCIICLGTPRDGDPMSQRSDAHVIPESVGGKLSSPLLCKRCNFKMGTLEAQLPKDVVILALVDVLEDRLPAALVNSIRRHAGYFVDTPQFERIYASFNREGVLTPQESETIREDRNALRQIEAELDRRGADADVINAKLSEFAEAEKGTTLEVTPGMRIVKGIPLRELEWERTYNEPVVSHAVLLGIAYLFLALCIGDHVYDDSFEPTRVALRDAVTGDKALEETSPFTPMRTKASPEPKHALSVAQEGDGALGAWVSNADGETQSLEWGAKSSFGGARCTWRG